MAWSMVVMYTCFLQVKKFHADSTHQNLYSFQGWQKPMTKGMGSSRFWRWPNTPGMAWEWLPVHKLFALPLHSKHVWTPPDSLIWTSATAFAPHANWQTGGQQQWVSWWDKLGWVQSGLGGVKGQDGEWDHLECVRVVMGHIRRCLLVVSWWMWRVGGQLLSWCGESGRWWVPCLLLWQGKKSEERRGVAVHLVIMMWQK